MRSIAVNRAELKKLAKERIRDARALLAAKRWSGAYYLAGYAVECALKARILRYVEATGVIFPDRKYAERCWTHDLEELVKLADLEATRGQKAAANPPFGKNWLVVKDWSEQSRYRRTPHHQAKKLFKAITNLADGVLPWIKTHW